MKTKAWLFWLVGWLFLLLLLGGILCFQLYRYLSYYEISRPELLMDELMASSSARELFDAVKDDYVGEVSAFEDPVALEEQVYQSTLQDCELSYRKDTAHSSENRAVYIVRAGRVNLARVTLSPAEEGELPFHLHRWQVERIEPGDILAGLPSLCVVIDASPGQQLFVNGIALTEDYLVDRSYPNPSLGEVEQRFPEPPALYRYRIDKMYGEIAVTTRAGTALSPRVEGNTAYYSAAEESTHRIEFYAPSDVRVLLNGAELQPEDALSRSPGVLAGLEETCGADAYDTLHFVFEGLYSQPELLVQEYDGTVLEPFVTESGIPHYYHVNDPACEAGQLSRVTEYFNAYTRYSTRSFSAENQLTLLKMTLPGSELYQYIVNSEATMIWAVTTQVNSYDILSYRDFHPINEDCFVCSLYYVANLTRYGKDGTVNFTEENFIRFCFVKFNGRYVCAAMDFLTD